MKMIEQSQDTEIKAASECRIIVAYEDNTTRERAMTLLGPLPTRFDQEIGFAVTWWKFRYLQDPDISLVARQYAASADIVVFASDLPGLFPLSIMNWIESWTEKRSKDGGVLVPLIGSPHIPAELYTTKLFYLKHIANRAGLDFLPQSLLQQKQPHIPIPTMPDEIHHATIEQSAHAPANASIRSE